MKARLILFIFFILFFLTKSETWFEEVSGHDTSDGKNGYAGSKGKAITAFYLKGDRNYRVHYLGDDKNTWTGEYCCSDVVGIGRSIDAISISGGYKYRVRYKNGKWETPVDGYDIYSSKNGYAGTIGKEIDAILIEGNKGYRVAYGGDSSNVEEVSKRVVKNMFGIDASYSFDYEKTIIDNYKVKVTVKLEYVYNFKYENKINLVIKNNEISDVNLGDFGNIKEELEKVSDFNINDLKAKIEYSYSNGMSNGHVSVTFYFAQKKIEISAGSKITADHNSFRGGYTINIYLKDDFDKNKGLVLAPCVVFVKRLGKIGEITLNLINNVVNNAIQIIAIVAESLKNSLPSLLSTFLGYILFLSLAAAL